MRIRGAILSTALAFAVLAFTAPRATAQALPPARARIADAARADLAKLTQLERAYFAASKHYTTDLTALKFTPASGARITVSYASARTFSASAADIRFAPFICFVIVSSPADGAPVAGSPAEEPFCADSRFGTAATALAAAGAAAERQPASAATVPRPAVSSRGAPSPTGSPTAAPAVTPVTPEKPSSPATLDPAGFASFLRTAAGALHDSVTVFVQFAVNDARYDPSRGILEIALPAMSLPVVRPFAADSAVVRPALACFVRPAFVCGSGTLSYIARDLWHLPPSRAPSADELRSGLSVRATFAIGRRDDTPGPAITLLALVLQVKGNAVSHWEPPAPH